MPIPKPRKGENHVDFMGRCAGDSTMNHDYPDNKQRVAVCFSAWRDTHGNAGVGQGPKRDVAGTCCTPGGGESMVDFLERCVEGGDSEETCMTAWMDSKPSIPDAPMMHSAPVEMKWMPTTLTVKGLNEGERMISGIATTPSVDHVGDIVESMGAKYATPVSIPLLWMHQHSQPVGTVTHVTKTDRGISFQARIAKVDEPGKLKDRVDEAWQTVRAGLVKGVSIGFTPIKDQIEMIKGGGIRFKEWNWHELSLVTVPAQSEATIQLIRSLDTQALRAATGQKQSARIAEFAGVAAPETTKRPEVMTPVGKPVQRYHPPGASAQLAGARVCGLIEMEIDEKDDVLRAKTVDGKPFQADWSIWRKRYADDIDRMAAELKKPKQPHDVITGQKELLEAANALKMAQKTGSGWP